MRYLIRSIANQNVISSNQSDCLLSCSSMSTCSTEWQMKQCSKGNWSCSQIVDGKLYSLCVPKVIKKQNVRTYFRSFIDMSKFLSSEITSETLDTKDVVVHNSRNIHSNIITKYQNIFPEIDSEHIDNKHQYVEKSILANSSKVARELLSIWKSLGQQTFQYRVFDYIEKKKLLLPDFGNHKIHSIFKMSYHQYEDEFREKKIRVNGPFTYDEVVVHFDTLKSAICAIYENCLKYCKPDSEITITSNTDGAQTSITIAMISRKIEPNEKSKILMYGQRGLHSKGTPGNGIGMWIIQKMINLNYGSFTIKDTVGCFKFDSVEYGANEFVLIVNNSRRIVAEKLGV